MEAVQDQLCVFVFGRFRVQRGSQELRIPSGHESTVLQRLALNGGTIHRERLMEELWPDSLVADSAKRLRVVLTRLRRHTGAKLVSRGTAVTLIDPVWCDLDAFIRLATRAISGEESTVETRNLCLRAQALWQGAPLEDQRYRPWADTLRRRATELQQQMWELAQTLAAE